MKKIHFMGIGGSGANAAAGIAHEMGYVVSGCDQKESAYAKNLEKLGIVIEYHHDVAHLEGINTVCVSPAFFEQVEKPAEFVEAQKLGLPVVSWQQFMGEELQYKKRVVAIAGTKGKTTTTSFVGQLLETAGLDPTVAVGGDVKKWGQNYRFGKNEWFVCEADEFGNNFHHYHADLAVVTNIELDHPEFFSSYQEYLQSYVEFIRLMKKDSVLILGVDSPGIRDLLKMINFYHGKIITYGSSKDADFRLNENNIIEYTDSFARYSITHGMKYETSLNTYQMHATLPGIHNILNLVAVFVVAQLFDLSVQDFDAFVEGVELPGRRFEIKGEYNGAILIDDYAHNPMSVKAVLTAAKELYVGKTVWAVWQPHMYSRTIELFDQFVHSFDSADHVVVLPIFASREKGSLLSREISHEDIGKALKDNVGIERVSIVDTMEDAVELLKKELNDTCVVVNMGAGDNTRIIEGILAI